MKFKMVAWFWGPVVLQMGLIFYFSHQPSGSPVLESFPFTAVIGHLGGYGLLALLLYRALAGGWREWDFRVAVITFLVAFLYGVTDEVHQYFIPGRECTFIDLLINGAGAICALLAVRLWAGFQGRRERLAALQEDYK